MRAVLPLLLLVGSSLVAGAMPPFSNATFSIQRLVGYGDPMPGGLPNEHFAGVGANAVPHWDGSVAFEAIGNLGSQGFFCLCDGVVQKIFLRGDPAPGFPPDEIFHFVTVSSIFEGQTAFEGWVGPPGIPDPALFHWDGSSIRNIADSSTPVPGIPGENLQNPRAPSLYEGGVTFYSDTTDPDGLGSGIWEERDGALEPLAVKGGPGPGDPPGTWGGFDDEPLSHRQTTAFIGGGEALQSGFYRRVLPLGEPRLALAVGSPLPGGVPGEVFDFPGTETSIALGAGGIVVRADGDLASGGFYFERDGEMHVVIDNHTISPATGELFSRFDPPPAADGDRIAFVAGSGSLPSRALWVRESDGSLLLIAREGEPIEDLGTWSRFELHPAGFHEDRLVFRGWGGPSGEAILIATLQGEPSVLEIPVLTRPLLALLGLLLALMGATVLGR